MMDERTGCYCERHLVVGEYKGRRWEGVPVRIIVGVCLVLAAGLTVYPCLQLSGVGRPVTEK